MTARPKPFNTMSDTISATAALEPETGFTPGSASAHDLKSAAAEKAREFVHTAEAKAAALKEKAIESAHHLKESAAIKAEQLKAAAAEKAHHLKESATEQWEDTREKAKDIQVTAEDYIRQHPTKCVLSALGIGFVIGLIVRR